MGEADGNSAGLYRGPPYKPDMPTRPILERIVERNRGIRRAVSCFGMTSPSPTSNLLSDFTMHSVRSDPRGVGRPRETSAGLYRGLPYKPRHAYKTNPRHTGDNRGVERRAREVEEDKEQRKPLIY